MRISESVSKTANGVGFLRRVSGGFCPMLLLMACCSFSFCRLHCDLPWALQHLSKRVFPFLRAIFKELHERLGIFKKNIFKVGFPLVCFWMWSFPGSSDGQDHCPSCLGYQHAEAALMDESRSHCGNMTIAMLRSRYFLAK